MELGQLREEPKQYSLDSELPFGKYKGSTIEMVIYDDPKYLTWCIENIRDFVLNDEAYVLYSQELASLEDSKRRQPSDNWDFPPGPDYSSYYDDD